MAELAAYLLRSGVFLAVFYALYWLVLRRETFFALNRVFLLGAACLSLVLPLLRVPSPFFRTVVDASALPPPPESAAVVLPSRGAGPLDVLFVVYAAGAGLLLLLFILRLGRLAILVGRCGCVRQSRLRVVVCSHPGESFSFFRYVFINKARVLGGDMDRVLAHELAHVRQLHSLDIVFVELLTIVQWFNPFVWPYRRSLRETHEYLADRAVIAQGCSLARYQLLIVEQHVGGRLFELASAFRTSQIKRRIAMLSRRETRGLARGKPLLILPLALALVLAFAESRTVIKKDPAFVAAQAQEQSGQKGSQGAISEEEKVKALQDETLRLEEMKKKITEMTAKLKQKLDQATDEATKEKIQAAMRQQKVMALEIGAKECLIESKKLEYALQKETDPAKKIHIKDKLQALITESKEYAKKAEDLREAAGPERSPGRKVEKK